MAGLCEGGNEPAGSLKAICNLLDPHQQIMSRSKSGVKRSPIDPDALKKAVEAVIAPPGNKISIREACSGL
ncbi:hypothetical protein ANN_20616 [Periplaneta americana]|uniref:Uncharacterized protein n=1 Tax=Periplaneta americana TaxID=6978 RepID=A0ABQ8SDG8_PERAM|nr:hypothetical protein ANN_20616 [Periplaneta americana]